tara:strand:- start:116 stop:2164 length:2049 start_codon:yes stop_codon:yes gene_type:complete
MSRVQQYQASFSIGEIDPLLYGRLDLQQYYTSVSSAKNVIFEPQGGFSRRPGLKFLLDLTSHGAANSHHLVPFEFSSSQSFMIVMTAQNNQTTIRMHFFQQGTLLTNINGSGNNYIDFNVGTLYATSTFDLAKLSFTQSADTLICVHPNFVPFKVVRGATNTTWTATSLASDLTVPKHAFSLSTSSPSGTITPSAVDGTVTITASQSIFSSGNVDQFLEIDNGFGRARITRFNSATEVEAMVEIPFFDTDATSNFILETGYEDAWSNSRGWPFTATFHEGRLYFGGSASLPSSLFGSKVGDFFNFKAAEGLDDDAIKITLSTDSVNTVTGLRSGRDLQIFTTGAEFFIPQGDLDPITPANVVAKSSTKRGAKPFIKPQAAEGGTLFIQRSGKAIRELLFSDVELSYVANNISLLASHLLVDPQKMALRSATDTTEGDLFLIVNGEDTTGYRAASLQHAGQIAAFMLNKGQNIVAPSHLVTDGVFKDIAVDIDDIYTIVKRTIGGATKFYLEIFDEDFTTDSAVQTLTGFSGNTYGGHSHLDGKTVKLIRDDIVDPDQTVSSGNVTAGGQPTTYLEAGLDYAVEVKTNPVELRLPSGVVAGQRKRILEVTPNMYLSQNLALNGHVLPLQTIALSGAGGVVSFTGKKKTQGFLGYSRDAQITITQTQPVFFTLLSLDYKVSVGQ